MFSNVLICAERSSKVSLKDLQEQYEHRMIDEGNELKKEESLEDSKVVVLKPKTLVTMKYSSLVENSKKEFTPKEKLLLNKLKKADEEAAKVG